MRRLSWTCWVLVQVGSSCRIPGAVSVKGVAVLGSTGSIGQQALKVLESSRDSFRVVALTAAKNVDLIEEQVRRFQPAVVAMADHAAADRLKDRLADFPVKVLAGPNGVVESAVCDRADVVIAGMMGASGIAPTLAAVEAGKDIALANKETLVAAGAVVVKESKRSGSRILPVDSEHSAIFQCLQGEEPKTVRRLVLTASGGPFRTASLSALEQAGPAQALKHPTWNMGSKITIDSATLMNKGLEVIEAHWLFGVHFDQIDVVIHPESIVHSLVEFVDGSMIAQMGLPDMGLPIHYALHYPHREPAETLRLDLTKVGTLHFEPPDHTRFPSLNLAYEAGRAGGTLPCVMNAANEIAVALFLEGRIGFVGIPDLVRRVMEVHTTVQEPTLSDILAADQWARAKAKEMGGVRDSEGMVCG